MKQGIVSSLLGAGFEITFSVDGSIGVSNASICDRFGLIIDDILIRRLSIATGVKLKFVGKDDEYVYIKDATNA